NDAYSADVGALYLFGRDYNSSAGISIMNVNQPDVSLGGDGDKAPLITKFGMSYRPVWGLMSVEARRANRLIGQPDSDLSLGVERNLHLTGAGALTFRGGYAEGSRGFKSITAGMSYHFVRMVLDYAFSFPVGNLADTQGSHRIGMSYRMGGGDDINY